MAEKRYTKQRVPSWAPGIQADSPEASELPVLGQVHRNFNFPISLIALFVATEAFIFAAYGFLVDTSYLPRDEACYPWTDLQYVDAFPFFLLMGLPLFAIVFAAMGRYWWVNHFLHTEENLAQIDDESLFKNEKLRKMLRSSPDDSRSLIEQTPITSVGAQVLSYFAALNAIALAVLISIDVRSTGSCGHEALNAVYVFLGLTCVPALIFPRVVKYYTSQWLKRALRDIYKVNSYQVKLD